MTPWPLLLALAGTVPQPSEHTVLYYNARMALREGDASEAAKLWLLRNALEDQTGTVSPYDADFRSVTWAALGSLGICQDGFAQDDDGVGLWPLALHNWVVHNMGRRNPGRKTNPFNAFEVGRQARFISITDVLNAKELSAVDLSRGRCLRPRLDLIEAGESIKADLSDRQVAARMLRRLLEQSHTTLAPSRVRGRSVIEARLFDLDLQLTALAAREARTQARDYSQLARTLGLSAPSVTAVRTEAPTSTLNPNSAAAGVLRACVGWPVEEWMALSPDRRLYLFGAARNYGADPRAMLVLGLGILDRMIAEGDGAGATRWIGELAPEDAPLATHALIWDGERGQRLLALDPVSGFKDRAVIAAHRGIDQLSRGDLPSALRSMAYARQHASESKASVTLDALSLRWLTYIAAQFAITQDLLITLSELVQRRDYGVILEDLMWSAALHADLPSFETGLKNQLGRGAMERRLTLLRPLAAGDRGRFTAQIRAGLAESPGETFRFIDQLIQRIELEDGDVRAAQLPTLASIRRQLEPLTAEDGRMGIVAGQLVERAMAIEQGLGGLPTSTRDRARVLAPSNEVFAGNVRLAPADPLPWPFLRVEAAAPSVFAEITLVPIEWRDPEGELVFGWSIRG